MNKNLSNEFDQVLEALTGLLDHTQTGNLAWKPMTFKAGIYEHDKSDDPNWNQWEGYRLQTNAAIIAVLKRTRYRWLFGGIINYNILAFNYRSETSIYTQTNKLTDREILKQAPFRNFYGSPAKNLFSAIVQIKNQEDDISSIEGSLKILNLTGAESNIILFNHTAGKALRKTGLTCKQINQVDWKSEIVKQTLENSATWSALKS